MDVCALSEQTWSVAPVCGAPIGCGPWLCAEARRNLPIQHEWPRWRTRAHSLGQLVATLEDKGPQASRFTSLRQGCKRRGMCECLVRRVTA